jgi:hypothetical protein
MQYLNSKRVDKLVVRLHSPRDWEVNLCKDGQ